MPRSLAVVPARYGSGRLPGKPLADLGGVPMIVRVLRGISGAVDMVVAATDDSRIAGVVEDAGFTAVITGDALSGTERVYRAWRIIGEPGEVIINVQGDEPMVKESWMAPLSDDPPGDRMVHTLARPLEAADAESPDCVKVVLDSRGEAMYFSRVPVPYGSGGFLEHVGIYAFSPASLKVCATCGSTELSTRERLEQLAWMERGIRIRVSTGNFHGFGVDTPGDLEKAVRYFEEK